MRGAMKILGSPIDNVFLIPEGLDQDQFLQGATATIVIGDNFQNQLRPQGRGGMITTSETAIAVATVTKDGGPIHTHRNLDHHHLIEDKSHIVLVGES